MNKEILQSLQELMLPAMNHSNRVCVYRGGKIHPPTSLSKVGKYALGNEGTRVACKSVRSASQDLHVTRVLWFPNVNKKVYFNP